jgi:uncharacterized protein (TIGR00369 family)
MARLADVIAHARETQNAAELIEALPYAKMLGLRFNEEADGDMQFWLPPAKSNVGNPTLPAIHGGALGGFMEMSAALHLLLTTKALTMPKVVDFSIDYVRAGRLVDTYASCYVVRQGRAIANVAVTSWQTDIQDPIATARAHFILEE